MDTDERIRQELKAAEADRAVATVHRLENRLDRRKREAEKPREAKVHTLAEARTQIRQLTRILSYCAAATETGEIRMKLAHVNGPLPDVSMETEGDEFVIRVMP